MTFADHFSLQAGDYVRYRPGYPQALYAYLAELAPARMRAWDCATGNGQAARGLATYFDQVLASDASATQIARADPLPGVTFQVAPAEAVPLADASTDLVTVAQALHWLNLTHFSAEVSRVLKPGGILAVWCYQLIRINPEVDRIISGFYHDTLGHYWPPQRALVDQGYAGIQLPFDELQAPTFEMNAQWNLGHLIGYLGSWSAVQKYRTETGADPLAELTPRLHNAWPPNGQPLPVTWPLTLRVYRL